MNKSLEGILIALWISVGILVICSVSLIYAAATSFNDELYESYNTYIVMFDICLGITFIVATIATILNIKDRKNQSKEDLDLKASKPFESVPTSYIPQALPKVSLSAETTQDKAIKSENKDTFVNVEDFKKLENKVNSLTSLPLKMSGWALGISILSLILSLVIPGPEGPIGMTGPQGEQGEQGIQGETGARGPQGEQGLRGLDGINGRNGSSSECSYSSYFNKVTCSSNPFGL